MKWDTDAEILVIYRTLNLTIPSLKLSPSAVSTAYSFRPLLRFPMVVPNYCSSTSVPSHTNPLFLSPVFFFLYTVLII